MMTNNKYNEFDRYFTIIPVPGFMFLNMYYYYVEA